MSNDIPVQVLEACVYRDVNLHTPVINLHTLEYDTWVHLPSYARGCRLFQIDEFLPDGGEVIDFSSVEQELGKPWIRITYGLLNISEGQHVYRLHFIDRNDAVFSLYVSYIIQNDDPDKPYVYMGKPAPEYDTETVG